jgi:hypothetical protein
MNVTATVVLTDAERTELARILDCPAGQLAQRLRPFASAALKEYVTMFLGQKVFNRGSDMREYRLFLLIEEAFHNEVPEEQEISRLFQTTATESRSLIRSVMSKYQYQIQEALKRSIAHVIEEAQQPEEGESYRVTVNSRAVVEAMNRALAGEDGTLQPVRKVRDSVATYEISPASYACLEGLYG